MQPFRSQEDDGAFEYMPSEQSSQANIDNVHEMADVMTLSTPMQYTVQQEKLSPSKLRQSNQSLVYSASSQNTELINSPQFGHPTNPKPNILVSPQESIVDQMVKNLQMIPLQSNFKQPEEIQQFAPKPQMMTSMPHSNKNSTVIKSSQIHESPSKSQEHTNEMHNHSQYEQLQQEIRNLNEQLIQERLNSEQLRVYNHIIKHELEKKLTNQGVFIVKDNSQRPCKQSTPTKKGQNKKLREENAIDIYLEIQHNRIQMQALQSEFKQKDQIIAQLEAQLKQANVIAELIGKHDTDLEKQNSQLQESIRQAMETIENARNTIAQLEDEKSGLITCIEEEEQIIKQLKHQLEVERTASEKLKNQISSIYNQLDESNRQVAQYQQQTEQERLQTTQIFEELKEKERLLQETEEHRRQLSHLVAEKDKETMQYQLQLSETNNRLLEQEQTYRDLSRQHIQSENLHEQVTAQKQTIKDLKQQLKGMKDDNKMLMSVNKQLKQQLQQATEMIEYLKQQNNQLDQSNQHLQVTIKQATQTINNAQTNISKQGVIGSDDEHNNLLILQNQLNQQRRSNENVNNLVNSHSSDKQNELIQNLQMQIKTLMEQNQSLYNERQLLVEEMDRMQGQSEDSQLKDARIQSTIMFQDIDLERINQELLEEKRDALAHIHTLEIKSDASIQHLQDELMTAQRNLKQEINQRNIVESISQNLQTDDLKSQKLLLQEKEEFTLRLQQIQKQYQLEIENYQRFLNIFILRLVTDLRSKLQQTQLYDSSTNRRDTNPYPLGSIEYGDPFSIRGSKDQMSFKKMDSAPQRSNLLTSPVQNQNNGDLVNIPAHQQTLPKRRYYL